MADFFSDVSRSLPPDEIGPVDGTCGSSSESGNEFAVQDLPGSDDQEESNRNDAGFFSRAVRAVAPVQMLALLVLGAVALIPIYTDDANVGANSFLHSLHPMLRHYDGPPPA